jgi:hypothetical protein
MAAVRTTNSQLCSGLLNQFCKFTDYVDAIYRLQVTCFVFDEDESICFEYLDKLINMEKISKSLFVDLILSLMFWRPAPPNQLLNPLLRNAFDGGISGLSREFHQLHFRRTSRLSPTKSFAHFVFQASTFDSNFAPRAGLGATWNGASVFGNFTIIHFFSFLWANLLRQRMSLWSIRLHYPRRI